jgi:acetylornithine deacetylase/succinyl-diaminopimelate desuccinylase-like protein
MQNYMDKLPQWVEEIKAIKETIISNIVLIGQVPAPTFREKKRANLFLERLAESGVDECTTDGYRNPIGIIRGQSDGRKPPIFLVAHLDTFFDQGTGLNYRVGQDTITGAGLMDNSLGVGVLASLPDILNRLGLRFKSDIVLAGVVQSVRNGNLRGIRHLLKTWSTPIRGGICIEGGELGRLNYFSDGMIRGEIECTIDETEKITHRHQPNAILVLNEVINQILKIRLPQRPRTRIVIGRINGGVDHGANADRARLGFELRSFSDRMVKSIHRDIQDIVSGIGHEDEAELKLNIISHLNATRLAYNHPLVKQSAAVLNKLDIHPVSEPSESALSLFLFRKIPCVTLGITKGRNYYQENATMQIEPMYKGIAQIIGVLMAIDSGVCDGN